MIGIYRLIEREDGGVEEDFGVGRWSHGTMRAQTREKCDLEIYLTTLTP